MIRDLIHTSKKTKHIKLGKKIIKTHKQHTSFYLPASHLSEWSAQPDYVFSQVQLSTVRWTIAASANKQRATLSFWIIVDYLILHRTRRPTHQIRRIPGFCEFVRSSSNPPSHTHTPTPGNRVNWIREIASAKRPTLLW